MADFIYHVVVSTKNDGISKDAGPVDLRLMIQNVIEDSVMKLSWVTDMLVSDGGEES
jgi:hypothetical protein